MIQYYHLNVCKNVEDIQCKGLMWWRGDDGNYCPTLKSKAKNPEIAPKNTHVPLGLESVHVFFVKSNICREY